MDYSKLLHDYFDGLLDPSMEDKLFNQMASDHSLRGDLRHFIDIERAAGSEFAALGPSPDAAAGIFSTLGISTLAAGGAASVGFFSKYAQGLWSSGISSLIVASVMLFFWQPWSNNTEQINLANNQNLKSNIPIVSSFESDSSETVASTLEENYNEKQFASNSSIQAEKENANLSGIDDFNNDSITEETLTSNNSNFDLVDYSNSAENIASNRTQYIFLSPIELVSNAESFEYQNTNITFGYPTSEQMSGKQYYPVFGFFERNDFEIELRSGEYWSFPYATVDRSSQPIFENVAAQINYKLTENFLIGIDARQEFFFMDYRGFDADGQEYFFEQHTNFYAIGLTGKYNFLNYKNFGSFAQGYLGGNRVGQIGRLMLGFEYNPSRDYGFIFGVEGSMLRHFEDNNPFYSRKIGLHYGIKFNL